MMCNVQVKAWEWLGYLTCVLLTFLLFYVAFDYFLHPPIEVRYYIEEQTKKDGRFRWYEVILERTYGDDRIVFSTSDFKEAQDTLVFLNTHVPIRKGGKHD